MTYFWPRETRNRGVCSILLCSNGNGSSSAIIAKRLLQIGWPNNPAFIYIKHLAFCNYNPETERASESKWEKRPSKRETDSNHLPIEIRLHPLFEINYHAKCAHASMRYKTPISLHSHRCLPFTTITAVLAAHSIKSSTKYYPKWMKSIESRQTQQHILHFT